MKQFKACGARNLPSIDYGRNAAWLQLAALATTLTAWLRHLGLDGDLATAATKKVLTDRSQAQPGTEPATGTRQARTSTERDTE